MRFVSIALAVLSATVCHAQNNYVKTSDPDFAPGIVQLPVPQKLHTQGEYNGQPTRGIPLPHLSGDWEYCYSFVDELGRVTAQSPVVRVTSPGKNCSYTVRFPNIPKWQKSVGIVLWYKRPAGLPTTFGNGIEYEWLVFGAPAGCNDPSIAVRPVFPLSGYYYHGLRAHSVSRCVWYQGSQLWRPYSDTLFWPRSPDMAPTSAPVVTPHFIPDKTYDVAISWVGHYGETALSEPIGIASLTGDETECATISLRRVEIPPQGALGFYLYMRPAGGTWHRQPNIYSATNYLWPAISNKVVLYRFIESNIQPSTPDGRSYLCSLQKCLQYSLKSVVVDSDQVTYSPVVNPLNNPAGTATNRTITGAHGLEWRLTTGTTLPDGTTGFQMCWPMWIENTQGTTLENATLTSWHADGGVDFCDHGGSGAFYFSMLNCRIYINRPLSTAYTFGIRQSWEGTSINSHGWSDSESYKVRIGAYHPIVIEGNQSLNLYFRSFIVNGGSGAAGVSQNNAASLTIDGMTVEGTRSFFDILWAQQLEARNLFTDQGMPCYVCQSHISMPTDIDLHFRKVNHKTDWLHLLESPAGGNGIMNLLVKCKETQVDFPAMQTLVYTPRYVGVRYSVSPVPLFNNLVLSQPSLQWWMNNNDLSAGKSYYKKWDNGQDVLPLVKMPKQYGIAP